METQRGKPRKPKTCMNYYRSRSVLKPFLQKSRPLCINSLTAIYLPKLPIKFRTFGVGAGIDYALRIGEYEGDAGRQVF